MSVGKKVMWIFLSVLILVFSLSLTIYFYQFSNHKMHVVLQDLIVFNNSVNSVRQKQLSISQSHTMADVYDLRVAITKMKIDSQLLYKDIGSSKIEGLSVHSLSTDISNYHSAIDDYVAQLQGQKNLSKELEILSDKLHMLIIKEVSNKGLAFHMFEKDVSSFLFSSDPENLVKLKSRLNNLKSELKTDVSKTVLHQLYVVAEKMYLSSLNILEKRDYLIQSSNNFLSITAKLTERIQEYDKRLTSVLGMLSITFLLLSVIVACVYWIVINKYLAKFMTNHAILTKAIKQRTPIEGLLPITKDELGDLTNGMASLATELHEKDIELIQSEKKYRTYIDTTPIAVIVADKDSYIVDVNPGAVAMLGFEAAELVNMTLDDLLSKSGAENGDNKFLSGDSIENFVRQLKRKGGKTIYAAVTAQLMDNEQYIAFLLDISDRVLLEKQLKEINDNLTIKINEEVDKNRRQDQIIQQQKKLVDMGMMVSAIAHQWRQPLNALALSIQDVKDEYEMGDITLSYLDTFESNSMRLISYMSKTIDDFRDFFMPDKNVINFNIIHEVTDLVRLLSVQISSKGIDIKMRCSCDNGQRQCEGFSSECPCVNEFGYVSGYPGEFKQVVINLLYNSMDAINDLIANGVIERGKIMVIVTCEEDKIVLTVSDNGSGIKEDVMPHIFEPYYTTKKTNNGTGIGLYMSKAIIENHMKGQIYAARQDKGACFIIELPIAPMEDQKSSSAFKKFKPNASETPS